MEGLEHDGVLLLDPRGGREECLEVSWEMAESEGRVS